MGTTIVIAVITVTTIALAAGLLLSIAHRQLPANNDGLVEDLNSLLPQTQCAQCGYPGCRPYARAVIEDNAGINLCPPGGQETVDKIAALLGRSSEVLLREDAAPAVPSVAIIEESLCIGCTRCRDACPVDAIVGAQQFMHSIIATECTGCELCLPPCPVDCISLAPVA